MDILNLFIVEVISRAKMSNICRLDVIYDWSKESLQFVYKKNPKDIIFWLIFHISLAFHSLNDYRFIIKISR